jgi:hypothetical protein
LAAAVGGLGYSAAFMTYLKSGSTGGAKVATMLLLGGGLVVSVVLVAVYDRVRPIDPGFARWALVLGLVAAAGSAIHGAYDLANFVKRPVGAPAGISNLPNAVDPRGLMTFGVSGLAVLVMAWLVWRGGAFPRRLAYVGFAAGVLLIVVYLGRLIILNPKNPLVLTAAILTGFVLNPLWFAGIGMSLWRGAWGPHARHATSEATAEAASQPRPGQVTQ